MLAVLLRLIWTRFNSKCYSNKYLPNSQDCFSSGDLCQVGKKYTWPYDIIYNVINRKWENERSKINIEVHPPSKSYQVFLCIVSWYIDMVCWFFAYSCVQHILCCVFVLFFIVNVASFSGLSFFNCPFGILYRMFIIPLFVIDSGMTN